MTEATFNVCSWNVLSDHLKSNKKLQIDHANPSYIYNKINFPDSETRHPKFKVILNEWFQNDRYDIICFQQVSIQLANYLFEQKDTSSNLFYRYKWNHKYEAVYAIDQADLKHALYFAGKQGILLIYNQNKLKISSPKEILAISNPFQYYLGTGSIQLFVPLQDLITNKRILCAASESYPHSWPLLVSTMDHLEEDRKKFIKKQGTGNKKSLSIVTFAKPGIFTDYVSVYSSLLNTDLFDGCNLLTNIPRAEFGYSDDEKKGNYFQQEEPVTDLPKKEEIYPSRVNARYRFFRFRRPEGKEYPIQSKDELDQYITMDYITKYVLNPDAKLDLISDHWPSDFNSKVDVLLVVDAIFIAEVDTLFFQERIQKLHKGYDDVFAFVTFPYAMNRTICNDILEGLETKWLKVLTPDRTFDFYLRGVFIEGPTWWIPSYKKTNKEKEYNNQISTCTSDTLVSKYDCEVSNNPVECNYGIISDQIYRMKANHSTKVKKYTFSDDENWMKHELVDLSQEMSDHIILDVQFKL